MPSHILQVILCLTVTLNFIGRILFCFKRECLRNHINYNDDPQVKCPYSSEYNCSYFLQDREIRALLNNEEYRKYQLKSLAKSEATMKDTFHCLTPDCIGFSVCEDNLNFFDCNFDFMKFYAFS